MLRTHGMAVAHRGLTYTCLSTPPTQVLLGEFEDDEVRSALRTQLTALQPQVRSARLRC